MPVDCFKRIAVALARYEGQDEGTVTNDDEVLGSPYAQEKQLQSTEQAGNEYRVHSPKCASMFKTNFVCKSLQIID